MWRLRPIVGALCAAGLLSGCGGGAAPTAGPTPSALTSRAPSTPVVTSTSTPTSASPSVAPDSDAAILAAARAYVAAIEASAHEASTSPFDRVTLPVCNCRSGLSQSVDALQGKGLHEDVTYDLSPPPRVQAHSGNYADVRVAFHSGSYHLIDSTGRIVATKNPDSADLLVSFSREGNRWFVRAIGKPY